jgi:hypothetical protein
MYLLYLDESGVHSSRYFVLAGFAIFERQTYWLAAAIDRLQADYLPAVSEMLNFHASDIREGHAQPWDSLDQAQRYELIAKVYEAIGAADIILFGIAAEKQLVARERLGQQTVTTEQLEQFLIETAYDRALEEVVARFDMFLMRRFKEREQRERGLIILAESHYRRHLEALAKRIKTQGHRWGETHNLADIPYFTAAENTRLLQVADFCANAIFGYYESGYARHFNPIVRKFDESEGVIHGLCHLTSEFQVCPCPACLSRRLRRL